MKTWLLALVGVCVIAVMGTVYAVPPGQKLEWKTPMGVVTFSGDVHAKAGKQCTDCHDVTGGNKGLFQMKYGADKMTMAGINEGKWCGTCHNGKTAFATTDPKNCAKCHQTK